MKINKEKEDLLTQDYLKSILEYNPDTGVFVWVTRGRGIRYGQVAGCLDNLNGYVRIKINGYSYLSHRLIWLYVYGYFPKEDSPCIDHIDGNGFNNRIENLKVVSPSENMRNKRIGYNNKSGFTGVSRVEVPNGSKTKTNYYWVAIWRDESGKQHEKRFSVDTHGENEAKVLAIAYRIEQIRLLELEKGVLYSERHGN